jgi:hypothetical protein
MQSTLAKGTNMKKFLIALGLIFASTAAIAGSYPPVSAPAGPYAPQEIPGKFAQMAYNINAQATGLYFSMPAPVTASAAATTQTLTSVTVPGNTFTTTGTAFRIKGTWTKAANVNSVTPILTFGTYTLTGGANTTSAGSETLECLVVRSGLNTQNITCNGVNQVTPIAATYAAGTSTETGDIAITGQCTQGSASADCILSGFTVEALR